LILDTIEPLRRKLEDSQLDGRVIVEGGAQLIRSTVRGPAIIGSGARIVDAYIGPYTAIGEGCTIERAEVEHSILLSGCHVHDLDVRIESSLLGRNVTVSVRPAAARIPADGRGQLEIAAPDAATRHRCRRNVRARVLGVATARGMRSWRRTSATSTSATAPFSPAPLPSCVRTRS